MFKFNKIVCIDGKRLNQWAIDKLSSFSKKNIIVYKDLPKSDTEIIDRIGDADSVLLGFNTSLSAYVLKQCPSIKYIGLCCTLFEDELANIDIPTVKKLGITIKGVTHYGDTGMVEYMFGELIAYMQGTKGKQWKTERTELRGKKIGIIGMGRVGKSIAEKAAAFDMDVYYYSRTIKTGDDYVPFQYLPLNELLSEVDIISFNLPRKTTVLTKDSFKHIKTGSIITNFSLGLPFHLEDFCDWIEDDRNFAIIDKAGAGIHSNVLNKFDNISLFEKVAGLTQEAKERLSVKVVANVMNYSKTVSQSLETY